MIMSAFFLTIQSVLLQVIYGLGSRDGIMTATYDEVLVMKQQGLPYLHRPLIVTDSTQSDWTLVENMETIFSDGYTITADQQTTNCSCLSQTGVYDHMEQIFGEQSMDLNDLCAEFAGALLYKRENDHYKYWNKFEGMIFNMIVDG